MLQYFKLYDFGVFISALCVLDFDEITLYFLYSFVRAHLFLLLP